MKKTTFREMILEYAKEACNIEPDKVQINGLFLDRKFVNDYGDSPEGWDVAVGIINPMGYQHALLYFEEYDGQLNVSMREFFSNGEVYL